jgi:hypothetical protein
MQMPVRQPPSPSNADHAQQGKRTRRAAVNEAAIEPAGCCVELCTPVGCTCVVEAPFC